MKSRKPMEGKIPLNRILSFHEGINWVLSLRKNSLGRPPFFSKRQFNLYPYAQLSADVSVHTEMVLLSTRWWSEMAHLFAVCWGSSFAFQWTVKVFVRVNAAAGPGRYLQNSSLALSRVLQVLCSSWIAQIQPCKIVCDRPRLTFGLGACTKA